MIRVFAEVAENTRDAVVGNVILNAHGVPEQLTVVIKNPGSAL